MIPVDYDNPEDDPNLMEPVGWKVVRGIAIFLAICVAVVAFAAYGLPAIAPG